jgi:glucose-1-phosphate adenylyltransferase
MGIYVFNWQVLKEYLLQDDKNTRSDHDFGKNIIPKMLSDEKIMYAYKFNGYWKDVGTIESLWRSNMDLLESPPVFNLYDPSWKIYGRNQSQPPHFIASSASARESIICEGSVVYGNIKHSIISTGVYIGEGAVVKDSIIMPYARIEKNSYIDNSIIAEGAVIGENCIIGRHTEDMSLYQELTLVGENVNVPQGTIIERGTPVDGAFIDGMKENENSTEKEEEK